MEKTNKTVAITGSTGGLGREICDCIAPQVKKLILINRNVQAAKNHKNSLLQKYKNLEVECINCNLDDIQSVQCAVEQLKNFEIDVLIHNAGAYSIPRKICSTGYDNVFQINFASPYYITKELLPNIRKRNGKIVAVGSIAHNYSKIRENDVDFSSVKSCSKVYGNSKRYLMFALHELFKNEKEAKLTIAHPGITFTNITAHYPPIIFAIIKHPMKVIFMKPKKAAMPINRAIFEDGEYLEWFGPRIFDIWGKPAKRKLKTCSANEREKISQIAERVYKQCKNTVKE